MSMTKTEYLLQCLQEEAAEVAQAASKCVRFGFDNEWPGYEGTALTRLVAEIGDLIAITEMLPEVNRLLAQRGLLESLIDAKKEKVAKMMEYSREHGMVIY